MKINKYKDNHMLYYYNWGSYDLIFHGLCNTLYSSKDLGYIYHDVEKGFWLRNKNKL